MFSVVLYVCSALHKGPGTLAGSWGLP